MHFLDYTEKLWNQYCSVSITGRLQFGGTSKTNSASLLIRFSKGRQRIRNSTYDIHINVRRWRFFTPCHIKIAYAGKTAQKMAKDARYSHQYIGIIKIVIS